MRIDGNGEPEKALASIRRSFERGSKSNESIELPKKLPVHKTSIPRERTTLLSDPKYRITEARLDPVSKGPETVKCRSPSSTEISEMAVAKAEPSMSSSEAGRKIDSNDEHPQRAFFSIRRRFDPEAKVTHERLEQP
jgi:hypothetical protein